MNIRTCPISWVSDQVFSAGEVGLDAAGPHWAQWWHNSVQDSELQPPFYKFLNCYYLMPATSQLPDPMSHLGSK